MGICNGCIEKPDALDIYDIKQGHPRLYTVEEHGNEVGKKQVENSKLLVDRI